MIVPDDFADIFTRDGAAIDAYERIHMRAMLSAHTIARPEIAHVFAARRRLPPRRTPDSTENIMPIAFRDIFASLRRCTMVMTLQQCQ